MKYPELEAFQARGEAFKSFWKEPPSIIDKINDGPGSQAGEARRLQSRGRSGTSGCVAAVAARGIPNSTTAIGRIHRAHIQDASLIGPMTTANLLNLCWICHSLEHAKQLHIIGTDADARGAKRITFEMHEAAVVHVFGSRVLPKHVRIIL